MSERKGDLLAYVTSHELYSIVQARIRTKGLNAENQRLKAELVEAWKIAAAYSDECGDGDCDRYYNRAWQYQTMISEDVEYRPAREWAAIHGGMNGDCATNPDDCPWTLVTEQEFWTSYANRNRSE